jgi:hypothetical protein
MSVPILSVVIPTREGFEAHWLQELLKVKGDIEVILVYPPNCPKVAITDPRFRQIYAPFRGEIIQRITGLLNVTGIYTLSCNCDEYINPNIVEITQHYFNRFPDSWVMRVRIQCFKYGDKPQLEKPWINPPAIELLKVYGKSSLDKKDYRDEEDLLELPIAPLNKKIDLLILLRGRTDQNGLHPENFDKKVWKTAMVQVTIQDIIDTMNIPGPFKYIPFWCLDRLLGLAIQARFFEPDKVIGHWMPLPEMIRIEDNPPQYPRHNRFYLVAEILLLRKFSQYGYIWNLILDHLHLLPRSIAKNLMIQQQMRQDKQK